MIKYVNSVRVFALSMGLSIIEATTASCLNCVHFYVPVEINTNLILCSIPRYSEEGNCILSLHQ